jgi:hypothetical protein
VTGSNLDQDDPDAVGVLDLYLYEAPGLRYWLPHDRDSRRGNPGALGVNIPELDPGIAVDPEALRLYGLD